MRSFYGNFFIRSSDLLSLPTVNPDNGYVVQLGIEESLASPLAYFQTALLYTTCGGQRRIRVLTSAVPVTSSLNEIMFCANQTAVVNVLARLGGLLCDASAKFARPNCFSAAERASGSKLEDARDALVNKCVEIMSVYRSILGNAPMSSQLAVSTNLKMLPYYILGLLKNVRIPSLLSCLVTP